MGGEKSTEHAPAAATLSAVWQQLRDRAPIPQPQWLLSVLKPTQPTSITALVDMRTTLAHMLAGAVTVAEDPGTASAGVTAAAENEAVTGTSSVTSSSSTAAVLSAAASAASAAAGSSSSGAISPSLTLKLLAADYVFEGVNEVLLGAVEGESEGQKRWTFDLPASNKELMADLGISAVIVAAGLQVTSAWQPAGAEHQGAVVVGYFSSALEAALVREQVMGLTKSAFGVNTSYGVDARGNFSGAEWAELKRLGKLLTRFHRKLCMP